MERRWLIILNWNNRDDTLELLASLEQAHMPETRVLLVDNGSTDGTVDAVRRSFPWVTILENRCNLGYAGGNGAGIRMALDGGAEVIGVINNDTIVEPDFWEPLVTHALSGPVAVSPDIRYFDEPAASWFFGGVLDKRQGWPIYLPPSQQPTRDSAKATEVLSGCCILASAETWRRVGVFDEQLFLNFEDFDWSMRARERGVTLIVEPRSRIRHKVSRSFVGTGNVGTYYFVRNGVIFAARWMGLRSVVRFVWLQAVRTSLREIARHRSMSTLRLSIIRVGAVVHAAVGRRGVAPKWAR